MKLLAAAAVLAVSAADQVHLSLTGKPDEMQVSWVEPGACSTNKVVAFGTSPTKLSSSVSVKGNTWTRYSTCMYDGIMTGLTANTQYYYKIEASATLQFVNQPVRDGGKIYAAYADFGIVNDIAISQLLAEGNAGAFDAVIHAGDFAYNMEDDSGKIGDEFMNSVQPYAARYPYMGSPGNHEADGNTFDNYRTRFSAFNAAAQNSGSGSSLWYSFNDALTHFVTVDTELWAYGGTPAQIDAQYKWLDSDLKTVDRNATPWVVGYGHKQDWMGETNFTEIETILHENHVNFYMCGHQHNYQRLLPQFLGKVEDSCVNADKSVYKNCESMTTVVVGSPGCREKTSSDHVPQGMAVYQEKYGYGHLQIVNHTHLHWGWEELGQRSSSGEFVRDESLFYDEFWVVQG